MLEEILNHSGIADFRFDFFGHGESEGRFEQITTSRAAENVLAAVGFVHNLGYHKICLYGSSFGGMACLLAAPEIKELQAMALKSPVSNYPGSLFARMNKSELDEWKNKGCHIYKNEHGLELRINYSFYQDAVSLNTDRMLPRIKVPVLIVHGDQDEIVPVDQSRKTASLLPAARLEIIQGADHTYSQPQHFDHMVKLISEFILGFNPHN